MTEGKSVGGEAPSTPSGHCTVEVLVGKWTTLDVTEGISVGDKGPSTPSGHSTVEVLVGKWYTRVWGTTLPSSAPSLHDFGLL